LFLEILHHDDADILFFAAKKRPANYKQQAEHKEWPHYHVDQESKIWIFHNALHIQKDRK